MKKLTPQLPNIISYFFIFLWVYAGMSKVLDFENFQIQLAQSPLLSAYAHIVSYTVIIVEMLVGCLLCFNSTKKIGLFLSFILMSMFTVYIIIILRTFEGVPCSCGGILSELGWTEHLIFNVILTILACISLLILKYKDNLQLTIRRILIGLFISFIFPGILFLISDKPQNNGFKRLVINPFISNSEQLQFTSNNYYFAGNHGDSIFLGNRQYPLSITTITPNFKILNTDTIKLNTTKIQFKRPNISINYPYFSVTDGTIPVIFEGTFPSKVAKQTLNIPPFFSLITQTNPNQYIIRTYLVSKKQNTISYYNSLTGNLVSNINILKKNKDGIFESDGQLSFDKKNQTLIYTYYYRNQWIKIDSELKHFKIGKTIDTISSPKINIKTLKDGRSKLYNYALEINRSQAVYNNRLYNRSALRADNEKKRIFNQYKVIDVYDTTINIYLYSFYIITSSKENIKGILVTKKHFYILTDYYLRRYTFQ